MPNIAIVYHSGYGHTRRQAEAVAAGVAKAGATVHLLAIDNETGDLAAGDWDLLQQADGIMFGSPTYMGSVSWQFKKFADASSKAWFGRAWKDKFAAGFTNSASMNGDKFLTISYMITLAMQHGMAWVGLDILPANTKKATRNDLNNIGAFSGAMMQTPADASVDEMVQGDLDTATALGERFTRFVARHKAD
ncbi:MAG TPA: flavodoxin family protein [Acidocella sp.]|jgi:multimeric flavodoxin WrbA|uniref:flavodoxin family protein n=1 Tax=Acidocella sp. TaxID=50710 RepID=UPI002B9D52FD|nr:flavodoxin family protein [Acidocella sp.]HVE22130.1 flavodoxin family protein [Acidocella sp.]